MQGPNELISVLLTTFKHRIYSCIFVDNDNIKFKAVIHTECTSEEQCNKWLSDFSGSSLCTWRVRKTYLNPLRGIIHRKDYICQHSSFNKTNSMCRYTKDTACTARLSMKVRAICLSYCSYFKQDYFIMNEESR